MGSGVERDCVGRFEIHGLLVQHFTNVLRPGPVECNVILCDDQADGDEMFLGTEHVGVG
jgi:hypothetical protein